MAQNVGSVPHVERDIQALNTEMRMTEFEDEVIRLLKQILSTLKKAQDK